MDADSALIWSPSHFTWMDTNFPAATPREGYPVEIQALWIRLLWQLASISGPVEREKWNELAARALKSVETLFWLENKGGMRMYCSPGNGLLRAMRWRAMRCGVIASFW